MTPLEHLRPGPRSAAAWRGARIDARAGGGDGTPWLGGRVRLTSYEEADCRGCRKPRQQAISLVDPAHPVLDHAAYVLGLWPELLAECEVLVDEIRSWFPGPHREISMTAGGGTSGPGPRRGSVMVMADNPVGYAEGVARELAHQKLMRLPPLTRPDVPVQQVAQIRELYTYLHVLEVDLRAAPHYDVSVMIGPRVARVERSRWTALRSDGGDPVFAQAASTLATWAADVIDRAATPQPVEA